MWILSAVAALLLVLFYQPTQECTRLDYLQQFFLKPAIGGAVVVGVYRLILLYAGNRVTERCMAAISMVMEKGETFSILIADIDNFKKVNDTYGHAYGDEVIREVASVFEQCKGKREFASRYGGEEFALIMPGRDKKDALLRAYKLLR